jgi:hypothetical protein
MLGACFAAMLVATLLGNPPIYDSLRERPTLAPGGTEMPAGALIIATSVIPPLRKTKKKHEK